MDSDKKRKKKLAILEILGSGSRPLSGSKITRELMDAGMDVGERTVRLYLREMEAGGLIESLGKRGRLITAAGRSELGASKLLERVGFMSARIDQMTYRMDFDVYRRSGTVVVNVTLVAPDILLDRLGLIEKVFQHGYAMGTLVGLLGPGESVGGLTVPPGLVGLCSVCAVTLNGVLLKRGVPTRTLFCGLLELHEGKPARFADLINYDGTSIDPLELFIRSGMTDYLGAVTSGNGRIGAGFREVPADSYELVVSLADRLKRIGLGGFLTIGRPGKSLFNIPVGAGCAGIVVIGGLNSVAVLEETGERVQAKALCGLMEYNSLFSYDELGARLAEL